MTSEIARTIKQVRLFVLREKGHRVKIGPYKFMVTLGAIASIVVLILLIGLFTWLVNLILGR